MIAMVASAILPYHSGMITHQQCRMARAGLGWKVSDLAQHSGVATATITRFEGGKGSIYADTLAAIHGALEAAGVTFSGPGGVTVPVEPASRLRKGKRE